MKNKFTVLVLMLAALVVFLPSEGRAATGVEKNNSSVSTALENSQTRVVIRRPGRRRVVVRRVVRRPYYRNNRRQRVVRQVYYRNGRRYVRTVRVY